MKPTTGKEKVRYFLDYYLLYVVIGVAAVVLLAFILNTAVFNRKETVVSVVVVSGQPMDTERISQNIRDYLGIEEENSIVSVSSLMPGDYQTKMALSAWMGAGDVDLILADKEVFNEYAAAGYFGDLQESLSKGVYDSLGGNRIEGAIAVTDDQGEITGYEETKTYGAFFAYDEATGGFHPGGDNLGLGIVVNSGRTDAAVQIFEHFVQ